MKNILLMASIFMLFGCGGSNETSTGAGSSSSSVVSSSSVNGASSNDSSSSSGQVGTGESFSQNGETATESGVVDQSVVNADGQSDNGQDGNIPFEPRECKITITNLPQVKFGVRISVKQGKFKMIQEFGRVHSNTHSFVISPVSSGQFIEVFAEHIFDDAGNIYIEAFRFNVPNPTFVPCVETFKHSGTI